MNRNNANGKNEKNKKRTEAVYDDQIQSRRRAEEMHASPFFADGDNGC